MSRADPSTDRPEPVEGRALRAGTSVGPYKDDHTRGRRGGPACPPELLARIADLELVARIVVEGLVSGLHRSPFHGYSAEFSQYRHYRPGDDLKYVDWKLVARTDRVYTKQFRETTNMAAGIVIDTSASMGFPLGRRSAVASEGAKAAAAGISKIRYALIASAALAHVISMQGDAVGVMAARGDTPLYLAPRTGRQHVRSVLAALSSIAAHGSWRAGETIRRAAELLKRPGLLLIFSDFYDAESDAADRGVGAPGVNNALRRASAMGHEVVLFQIMSRDELELPYRQDLEFTDLETGQRLAVNAGHARRDYKDAVAAFLERSRRRAAAEGFQYVLVVTDMLPDRVLRNFLLARSRSPRSQG